MPTFPDTRSASVKLVCALLCATVAGVAHAGTTTSTTSFEYDPVTGLQTAQVREPDNAQLNLRTQFTYDRFGNRLTTAVSSSATGSAAIPTRTTETRTYVASGLAPSAMTNALGQNILVGIDSSNQPVYLQALNGVMSTWQYDAYGRKSAEHRPDGNWNTWTYNICGGTGAGYVTCALASAKYMVQTDSYASNGAVNGPWTKTYYDGMWRVLRTETLGFDGVAVISQDTEYDALGRVSRRSRPYYAGDALKWTVYGYDALGRTVSVTNPDGSVLRTAYNGLSTTATNTLNQTRTTLVNSQGKPVQVTDAQGNTLSYSYDANGNLTKTVDPKGNTTTHVYDGVGRRTSMADPDLGTWSYAYDALSQLKQQTDAKGQNTSMSYDLLGRVVTRSEPDLVSNWTYDNCNKGVGKVCRVSSDNGYISVPSYDNISRPTGSTTTIDAAYTSSVGYDTNGRVATQMYPTGLTIKYVYSSLGYLKEVRDATSNALYWQANSRDAEGHLLQQTYGNNVVTQQVFDSATGRLKNVYAGAGNSVQNLSFSYDTRGNMLTRSDANQNLSESFLYDTLNRLTSNTVNSSGAGLVTQSYGYDTIGNITSRSDVGAYTYGGVNARPHGVAQIAMNDGSKRQYTYDAIGNLTQEVQRDAANVVIAAKGRTEVYSSFNMPTSLANPSATLGFVYGPDHQRIKQTAPNLTTIYVHPDNAGGLAYEKDIKQNTSVEHRMFITVEGSVVAVIKQNDTSTPTVSYFHRDNLGSTTAMTSQAGAVVERFAYEPFGKRRTLAGALDPNNTIVGVNTKRGFTNHEELDALGLIHMNGRVYDPAIGRFISDDPNVPYADSIQSYNRYSYTQNNPMTNIDLNGFADTASTGGLTCEDVVVYENGKLVSYQRCKPVKSASTSVMDYQPVYRNYDSRSTAERLGYTALGTGRYSPGSNDGASGTKNCPPEGCYTLGFDIAAIDASVAYDLQLAAKKANTRTDSECVKNYLENNYGPVLAKYAELGNMQQVLEDPLEAYNLANEKIIVTQGPRAAGLRLAGRSAPVVAKLGGGLIGAGAFASGVAEGVGAVLTPFGTVAMAHAQAACQLK